MVGETLGLWRLVRGLGRGGMGEVYEAEYDYLHLLSLRYVPERRDDIRRELESMPRAEQARLASEVLSTPLPPDARFAIKICNARSGTSGHRRFLMEAELAQRLGDHPYIVTVHAVNTADDRTGLVRKLQLDQGKYRDAAFMVMDLAVCTYDQARLTIGEAVHVVRCIATSLDHAHRKGIVHRDLKPENILGSIEHPLLTDFGIAKEIDQSEGLTRTGQIIGTLDYMSPEQATDAKRVDQRSDIYSLGVVLYEFATQGHLPYSHKLERDSALAAIRSDRVEPKWPREHRADFPIALERIILKAMAYRMEDRYQGMSELITDLDRFARGERIGFWGRIGVGRWLLFQVRRHPQVLWGAVTLAAITVVVALSMWLPRLLDGSRRDLEQKLQTLDHAVDEVQAGRRGQLNKPDADMLGKVRTAVQYSEGRYPELVTELKRIELRLLRSRRLEVYFTASAARRPVNSLTATQGLEELKIAARSDNAKWYLDTDRDGLVIDEHQLITLGPYGRGVVYLYGVLQLPGADGFQVQVREQDDPRHHATWRIGDGGMLTATLQEDERPAVTLRQERLSSRRVSFAIELGPGLVRTWIGAEERRHPNVRGLNDDAPAVVELELPGGTVIEKLVLSPIGPR